MLDLESIFGEANVVAGDPLSDAIEPAVDGPVDLAAYLAKHGEVLSKRFDGVRAIIHCRLPQKYLGRINDPDTTIRIRDTESTAPTVDSDEACDENVEDVA